MKRQKLSLFVVLLMMCQALWGQPMEEDTIAMSVDFQDIVITAQYKPTDSKEAVHSIRTINRETIEQRGVTNLEQLLMQDANIRIQQDLILGSSMSLLGTEGQNVKIMIDGVPVIGRLDGNIDLSQINLNNIERVEIIEGPMSVSYGTDALGGVINLISKSSQLHFLEVGLTQQVATRGEQNTIAQVGARLTEKLLWQIQGGRDQFDGIGPDSLRAKVWNPKEQWYANTMLRYDFLSDHKVKIKAAFFDEEISNLGEIRRPNFKPYAFDDYYDTRRLDVGLSHEGSIGQQFYTQTTLGYNRFRRQKTSYRFDLEPDSTSLIPNEQDTTRFNALQARTVIASQFSDSPIDFQLGIDYRYDESAGARLINPDEPEQQETTITDLAFFGSFRYQPSSGFITEGGLRVAHNSRYRVPLIPSFHLKYNINKNTILRASYAKGFRSPSLKELFHYFVDTNHFIVGNQNLEAESSDNLQMGVDFRRRIKQHQIKVGGKAFYNHITNKIDLYEFVEENGVIRPAIDTTTNRYAYFNQSLFKTQGVQLQLGYQRKNLSVQTGWSYIGYFNPLSDEFSDLNTFEYASEWNASVSYTLPKPGLTISSFFRYNDKLIRYYPEVVDGISTARQRKQDGYSIWDITLSQPFWNNRITLTAGINNVLNIEQINVNGGSGAAHSGGSDSPISPGRSYFARLALDLFWDKN